VLLLKTFKALNGLLCADVCAVKKLLTQLLVVI